MPTTQAAQTTQLTQPTPQDLYCTWCGDDVEPRRWLIGHHTCLFCGEEQARAGRASWTVTQQYQKGPYQYVTQETAPTMLRQTNQKNLRG